MKSILFLFLFFVTNALFGQVVLTYEEQFDLIQKTYDKIETKEQLILLDELIQSQKITDTKLFASIYQAKANKQFELCEEKLYDSYDSELESELMSILANYDKAVELCAACAVEYQYERYEFLESILSNVDSLTEVSETFLPAYKKDFVALRKMGMKLNRQGPGLGLNLNQGKEMWIGGELSVFTAIEPFVFLRYNQNGNKKKFWNNSLPVGGSFVTVAYAYAFDKKFHDFNFSFNDLHSPLHVNVTKFGFLKTSYSPDLIWYYRPEIGVGFQNISIYYAYNAVFKKSMRGLSEKHLFGVKIKFVPIRFKNNTSDKVNQYYKARGEKSPFAK